MKNKKGFSLIEILVSLVLISTIMVSMTVMLTKLKDTYSKVYEKTDIELYDASISRIINKDILDNKGIKEISCVDNAQDSCEIVLGNGKKRLLKINDIEGSNVPNSFLTISNKNNNGSNNYTVKKRIDRTTLEYIDTSVKNNEKLIYIKTMKSYYKYVEDDTKIKNSEFVGYKFRGLVAYVYDYENIDDKNYVDRIVSVSIILSDRDHDMYLFSSGTFPK